MAKEIERKFLVIGDGWRENAVGTHYRQGYLNSVKERTVRIRTINDKAFLTVKGLTVGCSLHYEARTVELFRCASLPCQEI